MAENDEQKQPASAGADRALRSAVRWYMVGFAMLGGAVGYFAGSSESPVIGTLLPLLFGLIGGASGLYLARADLNKPEVLLRFRIVGKALALFVVFVLAGSVYGICLRTGHSVWSFFSSTILMPQRDGRLPASVRENPEKAVQLAMLRARIRALGVSRDEERTILQRAAQSMDQPGLAPDAAGGLRRLAALAGRAQAELGAVRRTSGDEEKSLPRLIGPLCSYLRSYAIDYQKWAARIEKGDLIPPEFVRHRIDGLRDDIDELMHGYGASAVWLAQYDKARQRVWELQWALIEEGRQFGPPPWTQNRTLVEGVDRFLSVFYGPTKSVAPGPTKPAAPVPWELPRPRHEE